MKLFNPAVFNPAVFNTGPEPEPPEPPQGGRRPITLTIPLVEDDETLDLLVALLRHRLRL